MQRHESLAANLGAKLVAPLLLKSFEKLFEGQIRVNPPFGVEPASISWLDIVDFARAKPQEFVLTDTRNGNEERTCQFWLKRCSVEISEDDYRLIMSGGPERMIPRQPVVEDELAELGTMDILEQRLSLLIKRADLIAARARQLNYHLKGRKAAITSHHQQFLEQGQNGSSINFLPSGNQGTSATSDTRSIQQDLLRQFTADNKKPVASCTKPGNIHTEALSSPKPSGSSLLNGQVRRLPASLTPSPDDGAGGQYRPLITARVEKMNRGDHIWPPCDRCRRLRMDCTKYLTACAGCTKKHAKCTWRDITEEEVAGLLQVPQLPAAPVEASPDPLDIEANLDPGLRSSADFTNQMTRVNDEVFGNAAENKRVEVFPDEHAILTHMASAAAAQGNKQ